MTVSRALTRIAPRLAALALTAFAAPALAGQPVELRADVALHDGRVTLGDIFEGAGAASGVVAAASAGQAVVMDAGRVRALAMANGLEWDNATGIRRIIARADVAALGGSAPGSAPAAARSGRSEAVLAYGRDIQAGEIVQPQDLVWSRTLAFAPSDAPRDSAAVIGLAAKRPLRAGTAVALHDVGAPQVIKKDDVVAVAYEADGVRLVLQGKALSAASVGDTLAVLNTASKKQIQVVATGPGQAAAGPKADRLRAALRADPQLLASLR